MLTATVNFRFTDPQLTVEQDLDLVVAFSESGEHIGLMAQRVGARDPAGLFLNPQTPLGFIPVLSGTAPYPAGVSG